MDIITRSTTVVLMKTIQSSKLKIAIFFAGPSNERNISLDSARTFYDSIRVFFEESNIRLYFVDKNKAFYHLGFECIYSNTIEDFEADIKKDQQVSLDTIITDNDLFCPLIHGTFGEDGALIKLLEDKGVKAILGANSSSLALTLNKDLTINTLETLGYPTVKRAQFSIEDLELQLPEIQQYIAQEIPLDKQAKCIVKPNNCGSSDGVSLVTLSDLKKGIVNATTFSNEVLIEERIYGREFSIVIIQDANNQVTPLLPTEVLVDDYTDTMTSGVYSRYKKYMPGAGATHVTPMEVPDADLEKIRKEAAHIFEAFELSDWSRFDGFLTDSGEIIWSDLNTIPGYAQDSFFFQQVTLFGMNHTDASMNLINRVAQKGGIQIDYEQQIALPENAEELVVIGGGTSSERNVSRMSWMNVIQKINCLNKYKVHSVFQDEKGEYWLVPYFIALQHTIEEIHTILAQPEYYKTAYKKAAQLLQDTQSNLPINASLNFSPKKITLEQVKSISNFVFIALHGGDGENGSLQEKLENLGISYNGCDPQTSRLCMNKFETSRRAKALDIDKFLTPNQYILDLESLKKRVFENNTTCQIEELITYVKDTESLNQVIVHPHYTIFKDYLKIEIQALQKRLDSFSGIVLKPLDDGCSSGVLVSRDPVNEVPMYLLAVWAGLDKIPLSNLYANVSKDSEQFLKMPTTEMKSVITEQCIGGKDAPHILEMTVGVLGKKGEMHALLPSQTPSSLGVLTVEEKFNKGVGVNLTPPPGISTSKIKSIQDRISTLANKIGLNGYSRIDVFYNTLTEDLSLIEINSLPGLTAATIIYTQGLLTPEVRLKPSEFLDKIIEVSNRNHDEEVCFSE